MQANISRREIVNEFDATLICPDGLNTLDSQLILGSRTLSMKTFR